MLKDVAWLVSVASFIFCRSKCIYLAIDQFWMCNNFFFVDVYGTVVTCFEKGMEAVEGMDSREVILVLEETGVLATRLVFCIFSYFFNCL